MSWPLTPLIALLIALALDLLLKDPPGWPPRTASPNAGWPMAAAALTLQAGMGGPTPYFGELKQKPWIGPRERPRERPWDDNRIACLIRLVRNSGLLFALASALIYFVLTHHFA